MSKGEIDGVDIDPRIAKTSHGNRPNTAPAWPLRASASLKPGRPNPFAVWADGAVLAEVMVWTTST